MMSHDESTLGKGRLWGLSLQRPGVTAQTLNPKGSQLSSGANPSRRRILKGWLSCKGVHWSLSSAVASTAWLLLCRLRSVCVACLLLACLFRL
jgi:hypothetical protein